MTTWNYWNSWNDFDFDNILWVLRCYRFVRCKIPHWRHSCCCYLSYRVTIIGTRDYHGSLWWWVIMIQICRLMHQCPGFYSTHYHLYNNKWSLVLVGLLPTNTFKIRHLNAVTKHTHLSSAEISIIILKISLAEIVCFYY